MFNELADLPRHLAANLTQLRKARGLSQEKLAEIAGVPRSTVTYLESGQSNPSLSNLARVAVALQVSLEELLSRPRSTAQLLLARDVRRETRSRGQAVLYRLLPDTIPGLEMDRMELSPGARMGGIPHLPGTREYFTCVRGRFRIRVAGDLFDVSPGDVLAFPGDRPHSYENTDRGRSVGFSVVALASSL